MIMFSVTIDIYADDGSWLYECTIKKFIVLKFRRERSYAVAGPINSAAF